MLFIRPNYCTAVLLQNQGAQLSGVASHESMPGGSYKDHSRYHTESKEFRGFQGSLTGLETWGLLY